MGLTDYYYSRFLDLKLDGVSFDALIMLAMRKADSDNYAALDRAFPEIGAELRERYHAAAGVIRADQVEIDQARELEKSIRLEIETIIK